MFVAFFLEVGLLLIILPWSTFWDRNYFVSFEPLLTNNFVRGAISGLGVVNLCAALADLAPIFTPREHRDVGLPDTERQVP